MMTPDEKLAQSMNALAKGNDVRLYRAKVRRDIKHGVMNPCLLLEYPDAKLDGMKLDHFLSCIPGVARSRTAKLREWCEMKDVTTLGELSDFQRHLLLKQLRTHVAKSAQYHAVIERSMEDAAA